MDGTSQKNKLLFVEMSDKICKNKGKTTKINI